MRQRSTVSAVVLLAACFSLGAQVDPRDIVRKSVAVDNRSWKLARDYTYVQRDVMRERDSKGDVKNTHIYTREVMFIGQRPLRRLIAKDDRPLSAEEEKKEKERIDKLIAQRNRETAEERAKHAANQEKRRASEREQLNEIPEAFDFTLVGEEKLQSGDAYVIVAKPHPGYRGKNHSFFSRVEGKLWIDKRDYHWAKVEAESLDTISFGFFIARLAKGSHLAFEQVRVNNEIWFPKSASVTASARLALVKKVNIEQETTWSNYRKFQTDSRVTSTSEVQGNPGQGFRP